MNDALEKCFQDALNYSSIRPHSQKETEDHLLFKKKHSREAVNVAIAKLRDLKYLDDLSFMESWCHYRQQVNVKSRYLTKQELQQKGVAQELIVDYFDDFYTKDQERKNLVHDISKKWLYLQTKDKEKILSRYYRLGYPLEEVEAVIEELGKS